MGKWNKGIKGFEDLSDQGVDCEYLTKGKVY